MEGVFCQNSEWGFKLAVETDQHKRVSYIPVLGHLFQRTLSLGHIHTVRAKFGHSNPNPNFNPNPYFNLDPNPNPRDRGVTVLIRYVPADSLHSM